MAVTTSGYHYIRKKSTKDRESTSTMRSVKVSVFFLISFLTLEVNFSDGQITHFENTNTRSLLADTSKMESTNIASTDETTVGDMTVDYMELVANISSPNNTEEMAIHTNASHRFDGMRAKNRLHTRSTKSNVTPIEPVRNDLTTMMQCLKTGGCYATQTTLNQGMLDSTHASEATGKVSQSEKALNETSNKETIALSTETPFDVTDAITRDATDEFNLLTRSQMVRVSHYYRICITVVGLLGNALNLMVLNAPTMRRAPSNIYMSALACSDVVYLLHTVPLSVSGCGGQSNELFREIYGRVLVYSIIILS